MPSEHIASNHSKCLISRSYLLQRRLPAFPRLSLFVERAKCADDQFLLTSENLPSIAEITVRLDGLPLAIELAVARLTVMSPAEMLNHLGDRLQFLTAGARDLPERLQTIRNTIAWSYELLDDQKQRLFRSLAVFVGGFMREAAEQVSDRNQVIDDLMSLVQKSLVTVEDDSMDTRRFGMLETVREFGLERLIDSNELSGARDMHMRWCIEFLERSVYEELTSQLPQRIRQLDAEHDNVRTALNWAIESGQAEAAQRICGSCYQYWIHRGLCDEGARWFERVSQLGGEIPVAIRARALLGHGSVAYARGQYDQESLLEQALELYRSIEDETGIALTLRALGSFAQDQSDYDRADELERTSLELLRKVGNHAMAIRVLAGLGLNAYDRGDYEEAERLCVEALTPARALGLWVSVGSILNNLALVVTEYGDFDRAAALQQEALEEWRATRYSVGIAHSLENLARIAFRQRRWERVVVLFGAAESARVKIGTPGRLIDREENDRQLNLARSAIGEPAFNDAWNWGRSMSSDKAIDFALEVAIGV